MLCKAFRERVAVHRRRPEGSKITLWGSRAGFPVALVCGTWDTKTGD